MNYQSAARNQRTKGFKAKQAFQFALLLTLCIWLLYQFKHSHDNTKSNRIKTHVKISKEHGATILGRKGNAGKSDGEETYLEGNESVRDNVSVREAKQDQEEPRREDEESRIKEDNNSRTEVSLYGNGHENEVQSSTENDEAKLKDMQKFREDHTWTLIPEKDEAGKEKTEDKDRIEETGTGDIEDGVHGFPDENGVPEDDDIVQSKPSESSADKRNNLLEEMISSSDSEKRITESMLEHREEGKGIAEAEMESKSSVEDLKIDTEAEAEMDP